MGHGPEEIALRAGTLPLALELGRVVPPDGRANTRAGKRDIVNGGVGSVKLGSVLCYLVNHFIF